jgi:ABC-2 type transport system permease protein
MLRYELRALLRSPLLYLLVIFYFSFTLLGMLGTDGYFEGEAYSFNSKLLLNAPFAICQNSFFLTKLLLFITAFIAGNSLYKDYRWKVFSLLYAYPISKYYYLNSKLASVLLALLVVCLCSFSAIVASIFLLGSEHPGIEAYPWIAYLTTPLVYIIPTIFSAGMLIFVWVGISRNIYSGLILAAGLLLYQTILENVFTGSRNLVALLDPFGQHAFHVATANWNLDTKNSGRLPLGTFVILNRVIWLGIAVLSYLIFLRKFDFQYPPLLSFAKGRSKSRTTPSPGIRQITGPLQAITHSSLSERLYAAGYLLFFDFRRLARDWRFLLVTLLGGAALFFLLLKVSRTGSFNLLPLTRLFIGAPFNIYLLTIIFSTFLFSGVLLNRARQSNMQQLIAATPVKNWQLIASKAGAITLLQMLQLAVFLFISIGIQFINGYDAYKLPLYLFHLFALALPVLIVWNISSQFVHTLFSNFFLSIFVLSSLWMLGQALPEIGIHTKLLKFNHLPFLDYSDFNGYGSVLPGYYYLVFYWCAMGGVLLIGTLAFWKRTITCSLTDRLLLAKSRLGRAAVLFCGCSLLIFLGLGIKIFQAEMKDKKEWMGGKSKEELLKEHQLKWSAYAGLTLPKITEIDLQLDLYPEERKFNANGRYQLINKSSSTLDTILVRTGFDELTTLDWKGKAQLIQQDTILNAYLYKLHTPLQAGDSLALSFHIQSIPNTLFTRNSGVLKDGTCLRQDILPRLGYQFVQHEQPLEDSSALAYNYFQRDADYLQIRTRISTAVDQIAIAPGELLSKQSTPQRNIYEYHSRIPVKFNFSFHSANYQLYQEEHEGHALQVYYKAGHDHNINSMLEGLKAALSHHTKLLGAYPYQQIRIVEFPFREGNTTATLAANNMLASENLFGVNRSAMEHKIQLPFYIIAHEITHEWFGNQLMPADVEGSRMLTESITEWLSLRIYHEHFGAEMAERFLSVQYDRYHRGRIQEPDTERPLYKVLSHQEYISYGKGAIAFHVLAGLLGTERLEASLKEFLEAYRYTTYTYPSSEDFIRMLKANSPPVTHSAIDYWLVQVNPVQDILY